MDQDILKKCSDLEAKIDQISASVEKMRKYFLATLWITIILFVLPLIGLLIAIPAFIKTYTSLLGGF